MRLTRLFRRLAVAACAVAIARSAPAQTGAVDPSENAKMRIGPLALTPTLSMTNAGVDTNVFNEPESAGPKRDVTVTLQPKTDLWLHVGRSLVSGNITEDLVWFKRYSSERSVNNSYRVGLVVPLTRVTFGGSASYTRTRERPGFEIDARARRAQWGVEGTAEFLALSKTYVGVRAARDRVDFDKDEVFRGSNLHDELTRTITAQAVTVRHQLTALTGLVFEVGKGKDRFPLSPLRDSESTTGAVTVKLDPFALIKGSARFGYRDYKPNDPRLPGFKGFTSQVDVNYVVLGATKLGIQVLRDVQYSFDVAQPYYLQTGVSGSLAQQIFGPIDVVARIGAARLDYRDRADAVVAAADRQDHVRTYGLGVGYHLGKDVRVGFNGDHARRTSPVADREYEGWRYGTALTYGF